MMQSRPGSPSCRCSTWAARRKAAPLGQRAPAVPSRSTPTPRPTASCTWRLGSDAQWVRFVKQPMFTEPDDPRYHTNEGRTATGGAARLDRQSHGRHGASTTADSAHSPITPIEQVASLPFVAEAGTVTPDGRTAEAASAGRAHALSRAGRSSAAFCPELRRAPTPFSRRLPLGASDIAALRAEGVVA